MIGIGYLFRRMGFLFIPGGFNSSWGKANNNPPSREGVGGSNGGDEYPHNHGKHAPPTLTGDREQKGKSR